MQFLRCIPFCFACFSERYCGQGGWYTFFRQNVIATNGFIMRKSDVRFGDSRVLICPKSAPIAVSKTDNVKIITPEANQFADAWDIDYRKYHDLFVPDNKKAVIAVSIGE